MTDLTLRQEEVIRAVMLAGTIQGAATLLNVSAPGISRLVKHAEEMLGIRLFERRAGLFVPAAEAHGIFEMVHQLHRQMEGLNAAVAALQKGPIRGCPLPVRPRSRSSLRRGRSGRCGSGFPIC